MKSINLKKQFLLFSKRTIYKKKKKFTINYIDLEVYILSSLKKNKKIQRLKPCLRIKYDCNQFKLNGLFFH